MALPLDGMRVLDLADGGAALCGRYLADLGAEVIRIEPPGGAASRREEPLYDGVSIPFALGNANKLGITVDLEDAAGRQRLLELARGADLLIQSAVPGRMAELGLGPQMLLAVNPRLVVVSVTGFGQDGPYRGWAATEAVQYALGGVLSRSGLPGAAPLLPPAGLVDAAAAVHAVWAALLAYYKQLRTGAGELVDVSTLETVVHGFDPGFGTQGTAAAGSSETFPRGRPNAGNFYPVFPCGDGHVRICLLAKRQWRAMFAWLGEPAAFADPKFDSIAARFAAGDELNALIRELFRGKTRDELAAEGTRRGVPVGGVLSMPEVLAEEHFNLTGALAAAEIAPGLSAKIPTGYVSLDGARAGFRHRAPLAGEHDGAVTAGRGGAAAAAEVLPPVPEGAGPLAGLRVLDLGVIVFGAELGRQFADQGADVTKIENAAYPDGLRQSRRGNAMSVSFAWGHRNKRGMGLDLRSVEGARIFRALVAQADVVLANFKPGTLRALGFSYAELAAINPRIVLSDSSAFGASGPWSGRMGYGPLVRASCGVSTLWRYPDDEAAFCDGSTVYPDHVAGQVAAVAVLAGLIGRTRTGRGTEIAVSQADVAIMQLGDRFALESLAPGTVHPEGNNSPYEAPSGVFACAGDDEWCAVSVRDDHDWARLCAVLGREDLAADPRFATTAARLVNRDSADDLLAAWLAARAPQEAMELLQAGGVPAGVMRRLPDELTDPQLVARGAFATLEHEQLAAPLPTNARVARFSSIPDPRLRQAPEFGEHTREICSTVLGMGEDDIEALVRAGVLQLPAGSAVASGMATAAGG